MTSQNNKVKYVVYEPKADTHLEIVDMVDYMNNNDMREIINAGDQEHCDAFCGQFTKDAPYEMRAVVERAEIDKARKFAGKDLGNTVAREYPLITNGVLTPEEKTEVLNKAFEDAGFLLHAAVVYTDTKQTIDANITVKTGEKYLLTFKRVP